MGSLRRAVIGAANGTGGRTVGGAGVGVQLGEPPGGFAHLPSQFWRVHHLDLSPEGEHFEHRRVDRLDGNGGLDPVVPPFDARSVTADPDAARVAGKRREPPAARRKTHPRAPHTGATRTVTRIRGDREIGRESAEKLEAAAAAPDRIYRDGGNAERFDVPRDGALRYLRARRASSCPVIRPRACSKLSSLTSRPARTRQR